MVWIHGGAFVAGGTGIELFDCFNLVKENPDVICVTVAYRLGVLGFLHLAHLADGKDYPDAVLYERSCRRLGARQPSVRT